MKDYGTLSQAINKLKLEEGYEEDEIEDISGEPSPSDTNNTNTLSPGETVNAQGNSDRTQTVTVSNDNTECK